jgi:outer membrane protein assembly factor BamB
VIEGRPSPRLYASPAVSAGRVFIGADTGMFYALDEATGAELRSKDLGAQPALTCPPRGITSSATVAADPSPLRSGIQTVYVAGGDGYLHALDASTGALVWRTLVAPRSETENSYYNWSSPTVVGGGVFLGLASACDAPLVRGGVVRLDQATGAVEGTYWSVPEGSDGGSVWTSVASNDGSSVYASTGNGDEISGHEQGDSRAIVRVNGTPCSARASGPFPTIRWASTPTSAGRRRCSRPRSPAA